MIITWSILKSLESCLLVLMNCYGQFPGKEDSRIATVVIRGSMANIMDDVERAVDDGVNTYKALTRDARFVPGAGATEIELAKQLTSYGEVCAIIVKIKVQIKV